MGFYFQFVRVLTGKNILFLAQMLLRSGRFLFRCLSDSESVLSAWNRPLWESIELQLDPDPTFTYWIYFKFAASQARRPDVTVSPDLPNSPIAAQVKKRHEVSSVGWQGLESAIIPGGHRLQWMATTYCPARKIMCLTMISVSSFSVSARLGFFFFFADHVIYAKKSF